MTIQEYFKFYLSLCAIYYGPYYMGNWYDAYVILKIEQNWKCIKVSGGVKEQKAFEKTLFNKTAKSDAEILLLDGLTIVFKSNVDLLFYVIGSSNENELLLNTWVVLNHAA